MKQRLPRLAGVLRRGRGLHQITVGVDLFGTHAVLGERASLVGTDVGDRTQRFDRRQAADQDVALHHAARAQCQCHRYHGRQRFRDRRHREADGGQQHQHHRFATHDADAEHHAAQHEHGGGDDAAEAGQAFLQRRARVLFGMQQTGDFPEFGLHASRHDDTARASVGQDGSLVGHVQTIAERQIGFVQWTRVFFHWLRFAGECGLVDLENVGLCQAQVRRHDVTGFEQHDVPGYQRGGGQGMDLAVADHPGTGRGKKLQRRHRALGAVFLDEPDCRVQHHDRQDHDRVGQVADQPGNQGGGNEYQDHEVGELGGEHAQRSAPPALANLVRAVPVAAPARAIRVQAGMHIYAQTVGNLLRRQLMPGGRVYLGRPGRILVIFHGGTTQKR